MTLLPKLNELIKNTLTPLYRFISKYKSVLGTDPKRLVYGLKLKKKIENSDIHTPTSKPISMLTKTTVRNVTIQTMASSLLSLQNLTT